MDWNAWLERAPTYIRWRDLAHVVSPIAPLATVIDFVVRHDPLRLEDDLDARDPEFVRWLSWAALAIGRTLFRLDVHGFGNVPREGAALLVGNHNGGLMPLDGLFTVALVCEAQGPERALHPLTHDLVIYDRVAHRLGARFGLLRAGHESAARALRAGHLALVYPGSDIETFRPWSERHRIDFAGRTGFLRLALRERVPIIPVVATGTHEQSIMLTRGDGIAKLLRTDRLLRTKVMPFMIALPFGLMPGLLPYLPFPAQTSLAFGHPISWPELGPEHAEDPAVLQRCLGRVTSEMQLMLDALARGRVPFLGQPETERRAVDVLTGP